LGDAILILTLVASQGEPLGAVERLARMYLNLAQRHKYESQVLDDRPGAEGENGIAMRIDGVGAYVLLANESGLHQISRESRQTGDGPRQDKEVVRVDCVLSDPLHAGFPRQEIQIQVRPLNTPRCRLLRPKHEVRLLHRPSLVSLTAWTDVRKDEILDQLSPLLAARLELSKSSDQQSTAEPRIIRKYRLGRVQLVRDTRTGRKSGRVDDVLAGEIDSFLVPLGSGSADTAAAPETA
jgi:peptide chain release factor 2